MHTPLVSFPLLLRLASTVVFLTAYCVNSCSTQTSLAGRDLESRIAPEIWLTPFAPYNAPGSERHGAGDYFDLFPADAAWTQTAKRITVFKIYRDQLLLMSDDAVGSIINGLALRHIKLALETNVAFASSDCEPTEDRGAPIVKDLKRLKGLGADLVYLAMNEPLSGLFGRNQSLACRPSIEGLAQDIATQLKPLFSVFPNLRIGDIEPIGVTAVSPDWPAELNHWLDAFQAATGRPLAFLHADVVWGRDWGNDLKRASDIARAHKVRFGVIYTGDFTELSDRDWSVHIARYASQVEEELHATPSTVIFQTWVKWPQRTLPESDPFSMTGVVREYLRLRTRIAFRPRGGITLYDERGRAIPNARIWIEFYNGGDGAIPVLQHISGEVPLDAKFALFALRVNAETPLPRRDVAFQISSFEYSETLDHRPSGRAPHRDNLAKWLPVSPFTVNRQERPLPLYDVTCSSTRTLVLNSQAFPVKAGEDMDLTFYLRVNQPTGESADIALIFLGEDGTEIHRTLHTVMPSWLREKALLTDKNGRVNLTEFGRQTNSKGFVYSLVYDGDSEHRPSRAESSRLNWTTSNGRDPHPPKFE